MRSRRRSAAATATATATAQSLRSSVSVQPSSPTAAAPLPSGAAPLSSAAVPIPSSELAAPPSAPGGVDAQTVSAPLSTAAREAAWPAAGAATALLSPLASALTSSRSAGQPVPQAQPVAEAAPASPGLVRRSAPVAGVLAALAALVAVGLAGAARSTSGLAACFDLARLPFPRFRILPCPGDGTPGASELASLPGAAPPAGGAASARGRAVHRAGRTPARLAPPASQRRARRRGGKRSAVEVPERPAARPARGRKPAARRRAVEDRAPAEPVTTASNSRIRRSAMNSRRAIAIVVVVLASVAAAWFASAGAARMKPADRVLQVGDTVRVAGTATRCAVARRSGAVMIECLPTSPDGRLVRNRCERRARARRPVPVTARRTDRVPRAPASGGSSPADERGTDHRDLPDRLVEGLRQGPVSSPCSSRRRANRCWSPSRRPCGGVGAGRRIAPTRRATLSTRSPTSSSPQAGRSMSRRRRSGTSASSRGPRPPSRLRPTSRTRCPTFAPSLPRSDASRRPCYGSARSSCWPSTRSSASSG